MDLEFCLDIVLHAYNNERAFEGPLRLSCDRRADSIEAGYPPYFLDEYLGQFSFE